MEWIKYHEKERVFELRTKNSTYQMQVREYDTLVHLYYGSPVGDTLIIDRIIGVDRGFSGNPYEAGKDKTFSLDTLPQGYMRTGWIQTTGGNWYYLNPSGEIRYEDLDENGVTYHFDSKGICTNPSENGSEDGSGLNFNSDYQSILDMERLKAEKRLMDQNNNSQNYEESIVYEHDVAPTTPTNRYGLSDMQF